MIRVLQVLGGLNQGGAETMVMNIYRAIDRNNVQFDFVIHLPEKQAYEDEILSLGGRVYRLPVFNGFNYFGIRKTWNTFFSSHPEYKVLHSHIRSFAALILPIAKKYGVSTIVHSHSTSNGKGVKASLKTILQWPLRFQADYYFGCSKEAGMWLFGKNVVNSDRYYMIQNAIDLNKYKLNEMIRAEYRKQLSIEDHFVYIHVGRFHPAKNHSFLIKVFSKIFEKQKNSVLLLVGDGSLRNEIEKQVADLSLTNKVIFLGNRSDVNNLLMAADCFIFPSLWEGLPVTVVEAQAAGLPCVISSEITHDVNLSELVHNLPIDIGEQSWADYILNVLNTNRCDVTNKIIKAGFDISDSSAWLTGFYQDIVNQK